MGFFLHTAQVRFVEFGRFESLDSPGTKFLCEFVDNLSFMPSYKLRLDFEQNTVVNKKVGRKDEIILLVRMFANS